MTQSSPSHETGSQLVKRGLAEMFKGGVIMDVVNARAGARSPRTPAPARSWRWSGCPADIRVDGGVARMSDPEMIQGIQEAVTIPVMAKARIGHFVEAQILEALGVDYVDESEVLTPADEAHHIDKWAFTVPFVCGATNLGEALRRISEGACMIRSKGEAGTGNIVEAVRHLRSITRRHPQAHPGRRRRAVRVGQAPAGPAAAGAGGRRDRHAARAAVLRRWHRHPGRRRAGHAARCRRRCSSARASSSPTTPRPRAKAIVEATTNYMRPAHPGQGQPWPRCAR